jgi:hypothetical protein
MIVIGTCSVGLIPLPPECRLASASENALNLAIAVAFGFTLSAKTSIKVLWLMPILIAASLCCSS